MLYFIQSQTVIIQQNVLSVEDDRISAVEVTVEIKPSKKNLQQKTINRFIPHILRNLMVRSCSEHEKETSQEAMLQLKEVFQQ